MQNLVERVRLNQGRSYIIYIQISELPASFCFNQFWEDIGRLWTTHVFLIVLRTRPTMLSDIPELQVTRSLYPIVGIDNLILTTYQCLWKPICTAFLQLLWLFNLSPSCQSYNSNVINSFSPNSHQQTEAKLNTCRTNIWPPPWAPEPMRQLIFSCLR